MRRSVIEKRKKYTTNTYMREALDYDIVIAKEDNLFITIKRYKKMSKVVSFMVNEHERNYIDAGYYIVEFTPLDENYNIRFYFDSNKKYIDYYIDITYKNGVDHMIPYYIDLYLDILHYEKDDVVKFVDEEELLDAYNNKLISKKDYDLAYKVGKKLMKEILNHKNKFLEMDVVPYIDKYFS